MALEDRDIFKAICDRFSDQPIEFIMLQYAKAKRINMEIERQAGLDFIDEEPLEAETMQEAEEIDVAEPQPKKLTKRNLKVKPKVAITEDAIYCCVCGEERQSLTAKHLAKHGLTVEEYKKLCGYAPELPLMSEKRLRKSKEVIARAQKARLEKRASQEMN